LSRQARETQPATVAAEFLGCVGVFEAQFDYVFHTLRRHGIARDDVEDLVQEVFLVMWRRWAEYDATRPLRPWLAGIAFRVAYNHRQRIGREVPGGLLDAEDSAPNPEQHLDSVSARSLVLRVLADLPEKYRRLIVAHDLDGVPMREIAGSLAVPLFTAHTRLRAARQAFAKAVKRLNTVTAARADLAPLLRPELFSEPPPVPEEVRRRAVSRARSVAAGPQLSPLPAPAGAGHLVAAAVAGAAALALGFVWLRPAPAPRPAHVAVMVAPARRPAAMPAALARGVVGYWTFDDGRGSTLARDHSGNGNDCVLHRLDPAADWTDGPLGGAISLHDNGWLECNRTEALARLDKEITISLWIKRTGSRPHVRALVSRQLGGHSRDHFHLGFSDDQLVLRGHEEGRASYAPFPVRRGQWLHVAATRTADGVARLYLDGEEVRRKQTDALPFGGGTTPLIIGGGVNGPHDEVKENLEGVLDELLIYDRALPADEIAALATRVRPKL
jgi:RNA polymerase sigma-70 factor (ECF subfamily)